MATPAGPQFAKAIQQQAIAMLLAAASAWVGARRAFAFDGVELHTFKSHSRIVFHVDENTPVQWNPGRKGFRLLLKGASLSDLGVPLEQATSTLSVTPIAEGNRDARVASVHLKETPEGVEVSGLWLFPKGAAALAEPRMETFDYRLKNPDEYVVDFWPKKGPTLAEVNAAHRLAERKAAAEKAEAEAHARAERHLASVKAKAAADDLVTFCRQPLSEARDVFLNFYPAHENVDFGRWFPTTTPDNDFSYFRPAGAEPDARYVRLALDLYAQGKFGLVVRTLDFFDSEQPNSQYRHEMRFLRANAMIKLGLHEQADQVLSRMMVEAKGTPVAMHAGMFLAAKLMEKKSYLAALESFLWLIANHPEHRLVWVFHLGAAEALYRLGQADRAAKEYQWVVENAPTPDAQAEGALRQGDLYLARFQYEQALGAYYEGLHHYEAQAKNFPAVYLNRAETLYWLGQYDRAREAFEAFERDYADYPQGWRATFRLGEIMARGDYAHREDQSARRWFYETVNRYPFSPGATLARMRLAPCGDHGGFDEVSAERFYSGEGAKFDGANAVALERYTVYRDLSRVRMLISMKHEDEAVDVGLEVMRAAMKANDDSVRRTLGPVLEGLLRRTVLNLLEKGKKYEALAFYRAREALVRHESEKREPTDLGPGVDPDYLLKLSRAAADLGLGTMADSLSLAYERAAGPARSIAASGAPDADAQLALAERRFTEAKAKWVASNAQPDAKTEEAIRALLADVSEQSPFSFAKEAILGLLDDRGGKAEAALQHGLKAQLLMPAATSPETASRLAAWLAGLEAKAGDPKIALEMYQNLGKAKAEKASGTEEAPLLGLPPVPAAETIYLAEGAILEKQGKWGEAAATYARAMEASKGASKNGSQARYQYARALLKGGEAAARPKALAELKSLAEAKGPAAGPSDAFWRRLASETLADEESTSKLVH